MANESRRRGRDRDKSMPAASASTSAVHTPQKAKQQMAGANIDDKMLSHQEAIILAMTPKERRNPKILNGSRRRRIATGSGTTVQEVNRVLKQHKQMSQMMKKVGKKGMAGMMRGMPGGGFPPMGGGMPPGMR